MIRNALRPLLFALLLAPAVAAQEFDVFDLSDFVDPEIRQVVFTENGLDVLKAGNDLNLIRAVTGRIGRYSSGRVPTKEDATFLHVVSNSYFREFQANWKITIFDPALKAESNLPLYRISSQWGFYAPTKLVIDEKSNEYESLPSRGLFSIAIEQNRQKVRRDTSQAFNWELAVVSDAQLPLVRDQRFSGTGIFLIRSTAGEKRLYRFAGLYRFGERVVFGHGRVGAGFSYGIEKAGAIRWSPFRVNVWSAWDIPRVGTVNFSYTPTYHPALPGRQVFNEVSIFFDRTLYSTPRKSNRNSSRAAGTEIFH